MRDLSNGNRPRKPVSPDARKRALILAVNTLILAFIYFASQNIGKPLLSMIITGVYWLILAVFAIVYVAYNRAFSRKGMTVDMLPPEWTLEQKQAFIDDLAARRKKSKWALLILIPMILVFGLEMLELYVFPSLNTLLLALGMDITLS